MKIIDHAKRIIKKHLMRRSITEVEVIPEHDERNASAEYLRNRKQLIEDDKVCCLMCGTRENLEAHHAAEWAEWNAVCPKKLSKLLVQLDFHGYGHLLKDEIIDSPDHIANLCVLCRRDHRERGFGIHNTTGVVWMARLVKKDDVDVVIDPD